MFDLDMRRWPQALCVFLLVSVALPVGVAGTTLWAYLFLPLPTPTLPDPRPGPEASRITRIFDTQGNEIGVLRRFDTSIPVEEDDIPEVLKQAVVAVEDQRFYSHSGLDVRAATRAFWADIQGKPLQGGSTITQQYVKSVYTGGERTFQRKLREAVIASRIDRQLSKDEILYRYLSTIYFGGGAYGIGAAAESYFGKRVNDLDLSESAMLAGLINAPGELDPHVDLDGAERARVDALQKMREQGYISADDYVEARERRLRLASSVEPGDEAPATLIEPIVLQSAEYPYFIDAVRRYLVARYGDDLVYGGGLRVVASIDPRLQAEAEAAVAGALDGTRPPLDMAMVSVEPSTGFVKAIVGGRDFEESQVNLALGKCAERSEPTGPSNLPVCLSGGGTGRQPGSSFKPFTLAAAFEQGIGPNAVYSGPSTYTFPSQFCTNECTVRNVGGGGFGALTLRQATRSSVNTVYAQLITDVGIEETAEMAHRLGVTMISPDGLREDGGTYGAALTLGAGEVSPYDMAAAYSVFANDGLQMSATPVVSVHDAEGNVLEDNSAREGRRVISEAVAGNITDVLNGVVNGGTGTAAAIGRPEGTAGKTGTSESFGDAWFVGYTKHLSTAVWMGYADSRRELTNIKGVNVVYGGTIPARTWQAFMSTAHDGLPEADFDTPVPLAGDVSAGPRRSPAQVVSPPELPFVMGEPLPPQTTTTTNPFFFPTPSTAPGALPATPPTTRFSFPTIPTLPFPLPFSSPGGG